MAGTVGINVHEALVKCFTKYGGPMFIKCGAEGAVNSLRESVDALIGAGAGADAPPVAGLCKSLLDLYSGIKTSCDSRKSFVKVHGVNLSLLESYQEVCRLVQNEVSFQEISKPLRQDGQLHELMCCMPRRESSRASAS